MATESWERGLELYLPKPLHNGMRHYLEQGIIPGSFLLAVLENDLMRAAAAADPWNREELATVAEWVTHEMPEESFGSPAKVAAWSKRGGLRGK